MAKKYHLSAVHEIATEVDRLIMDATIRAGFTDKTERLCKMVEEYGNALQPYIKKLERAERRYVPGTGSSRYSKCPAPSNWVEMSFDDNRFVNIPMEVIYRPAEPVNPLLWFGLFGNSSIQRKPTGDEVLMYHCFLLAAIHDCELQKPTDRRIFSEQYSGTWFQRDKFIGEVWKHYVNPHDDERITQYGEDNPVNERKLSVLTRALERVRIDCKKTEPQEKDGQVGGAKPATPEIGHCKLYEKTKAVFRRIPYWIYILTLFLAALLTCLYYLGWLEPVKLFFGRIFTHK